MEGIEAELENKTIEKSIEIKEVEAPKKEKKPRSQAQKEAFEKARKKRAENLAKKKEEEKSFVDAVKSNIEPVEDIKPAPKRRGRPKKLTKNQEPQPVSFIPPPDPQVYSQYPVQGQFNPYQYWGGVPQPPPQPVVNNYYYGEQHHHQAKPEQKIHTPDLPHFEPEPSPDGSINEDYDYQDEVEEEEIQYPQTQPQLKYRFA
jgi:hypothetical protein